MVRMGISELSSEVLEALFTVNKVAKEYSENSQDAYQDGFKRRAKELSLRKDALYRYKSHILGELYDAGFVKRVHRHQIGNGEFYCFVFEEYSFHSPVDDFDENITVDGNSKDISDEFSSETVSEDELPMTSRTALKFLQDEFCSANRFVWPRILNGGLWSHPIGWSFLDEYVEEGDRVSEEEFERVQERSHIADTFRFAVGDLFETMDKGEVQIVERCGLWSEPFRSHMNDTVLCRPAYDVIVNGEFMEGVLQEKILEDWWVDIQDTEYVDGVTRISGDSWYEYTLDELDGLPHIRLGDLVVFESGDEATIDGIYTNDLVFVFFIVSWGSEDWDEHFAADEFLQDVVEIHRDGEVIPVDWSYERSESSSESELEI